MLYVLVNCVIIGFQDIALNLTVHVVLLAIIHWSQMEQKGLHRHQQGNKIIIIIFQLYLNHYQSLADFSISGGFRSSILFASSPSFGSVRILLIFSNSELDLITIPLFFVAEPVAALTGLISIAIDSSAALVLK